MKRAIIREPSGLRAHHGPGSTGTPSLRNSLKYGLVCTARFGNWAPPPITATGSPVTTNCPKSWISVPSQRARHDIRRPGQEGEFKGAEYSEFRNHAEVRRVAVRDHELLGFPHHPEIQDGTRKLALRLNSWACWLLPTSLETESNEVGEAGDLKGLRDPPQSLRVGGFFF